MKKLILVLASFFPAIAYGAGAGGINITPRTTSGGTGVVQNSTKTLDITIAGNLYVSTINVFGIPGTTRSPGKSTWTIVGMWADCALGSTNGACGFELLYSSTAWGGSVSRLFPAMHVSTQSSGGNNIATSLFFDTISVIPAHTYLGVGVSTLPVTGQSAQDCHVHIYYWEANKYSP